MKSSFRFDDSTHPGDPGLGSIRFNAKEAKDITFIFIDSIDDSNRRIDLSNNTDLHLMSEDKKFEALFDVKEVTNSGGYFTLKVESVASEGWPKSFHLLLVEQEVATSESSKAEVVKVTVPEEDDVILASTEEAYLEPIKEEIVTAKEEVEVANFNAKPGNIYYCDTTASSFQGVLPPLPKVNDKIMFVKTKNSWATHPFKIQRNGNKINGEAKNLICQGDKTTITLTYASEELGWTH